MNKFGIFGFGLVVLSLVHLTTAAPVNADYIKGKKYYDQGIAYLENQNYRAANDAFKEVIESLESGLNQGIVPSINGSRQQAKANLYLGISIYEYTERPSQDAVSYLKKAVEKGLHDPKDRAKAYFYWGLSLLAARKHQEARNKFEAALNPDPTLKLPTWLEDHNQAKDLLEEVRKAVTGTLTIKLSPPDARNWTISIWSNGKQLNTNPAAAIAGYGLRLYKGRYTVKGIYKGKSIEKQVTINPNRGRADESLVLEILPPSVEPIIEHEPPQSAASDHEIRFTFYVSHKLPRRATIHYRKRGEEAFESRISSAAVSSNRSVNQWTYEEKLPPQNFVGEIEYYIEAKYANRPAVRHPKNGYHEISIVDKTSPIIRLLEPDEGAIFEVNQQITITAEVTDNTLVEWVQLSYGFSQFSSLKPSQYSHKDLTKTSSGIYTGHIPPKSEPGYIWYYLTATDPAENEKNSEERRLKITSLIPVPPPDKIPPIIRPLAPDEGATFVVNEPITIRAAVEDDTSVKAVRVHFSPSKILELSEEGTSGTYTTNITTSKTGILRYYLSATDSAENESVSEERQLIIKDRPAGPGSPPRPPDVGSLHQGIWANYAWSNISDGFDSWGRGDVLSLTYLREGKTYGTLGAQLGFSYQAPPEYYTFGNESATIQWGPALGKSPVVFTILGGVAGYSTSNSYYITPILGGGLKLYPRDRLAIDVTGSINLWSAYDALADGQSIFNTTNLYHYEAAVRIYLSAHVSLKVGYGGWYLGDRNTTGVRIGLGYTF